MISRRAFLSSISAVCVPGAGWARSGVGAPEDLGDGWAVAAPSEAGFDPVVLGELVEMINDGVTAPNVHAVVIERAGRLVFEQYWQGSEYILFEQTFSTGPRGPETLHDVRSISKSVTALLLGIALEGAGPEVLQRPIASFFPDRDDLGDHLAPLTLFHVLTMTAGLEWNETIVPYTSQRNDFVRMVGRGDPVGFVLGKPVREVPGKVWTYNSGLTDVVAGVIEHLTGQPFAVFAQDALFKPLGIATYEWGSPKAWGERHFPNASAGLRLRARDLARIGLLVRQEGRWGGRQVVPESWMQAATREQVQIDPFWRYGYGYYWFRGELISGDDVIVAAGSGGQRLFCLPELDVAVTLYAGNYEGGEDGVAERVIGRIMRALR